MRSYFHWIWIQVASMTNGVLRTTKYNLQFCRSFGKIQNFWSRVTLERNVRAMYMYFLYQVQSEFRAQFISCTFFTRTKYVPWLSLFYFENKVLSLAFLSKKFDKGWFILTERIAKNRISGKSHTTFHPLIHSAKHSSPAWATYHEYYII